MDLDFIWTEFTHGFTKELPISCATHCCFYIIVKTSHSANTLVILQFSTVNSRQILAIGDCLLPQKDGLGHAMLTIRGGVCVQTAESSALKRSFGSVTALGLSSPNIINIFSPYLSVVTRLNRCICNFVHQLPVLFIIHRLNLFRDDRMKTFFGIKPNILNIDILLALNMQAILLNIVLNPILINNVFMCKTIS